MGTLYARQDPHSGPATKSPQTLRTRGSGADSALSDGVDELLAAVGQHLTAVASSRDRDEADDGQREGEADHHAEDESEHDIYSDRLEASKAKRTTR
jgi:hypothetical protein